MSVLLLAEHDNNALAPATRSAVAAATAMDADVNVLVAGSGCRAVADAAAAVPGVSRVLLCDDSRYAHPLAEVVAPLVAEQAEGHGHVVAPAGSTGKNILPRVAATLGVGQVSDIIAVDGPDTFRRPIYAGNAVATVVADDPVRVVTVRGTAFDPVAETGNNAPVETVPPTPDPGLSGFVGQQLSQSERPELTQAGVVISGGRGLASGDNFQLVEAVADRLGAAVGASRAAVDAGFISNDYQVGQTGKIVAPELYLAVGISGAIQHLAGMKDSKVIAAINKDEEAPIFQVADYGLVADLFEALPALAEALDNR